VVSISPAITRLQNLQTFNAPTTVMEMNLRDSDFQMSDIMMDTSFVKGDIWCRDWVIRTIGLYQRRLPPNGAALEPLKPPEDNFCQSHQGWNKLKERVKLTTTSTTTTATSTETTTSSVPATATTTPVACHLRKSWVNLLLCFGENRN
jgi:hypothetical protein